MKCRNCGAELNRKYCEYCGSFYGEELKDITVNIHQIFAEYASRDEKGRLKPIKPKEMIEITCLGDSKRRFYEV